MKRVLFALLSLALMVTASLPVMAQSNIPDVAGAGSNPFTTPTLGGGSGGTYAAGKCVGTTQQINMRTPLVGTPAPAEGSTIIAGLGLFDASKQDVAVYGFVLNALPTTNYVDGATCTLNVSDYSHVVGLIEFNTYVPDGGNSIGYADGTWSNSAPAKEVSTGKAGGSYFVQLFIPSGGTSATYTGNNLTLVAQNAY